LNVSAYNRSVENNRRFGPWFCLAMALLALWLIKLGYKHRHSNRPITELLSKKSK
jgi:hypothetical protein